MIVLYLAIVGSLQLVTIWLIVKLREGVMDFQKRFLKVSDLNLESLKISSQAWAIRGTPSIIWETQVRA